MPQKPTSLSLSNLSPGSSELSHADVFGHLARAAQTATLLGGVTPPPADSILKAIGGSATIIVNMIQQHLKNKKDIKNLISDIEKSVSMICAEAEFLSPLTSPRFHDAMNEFESSLRGIQKSLEMSQSPPQRKRDKLRRFFQSDSVRETLLEYTEEFRKLRENLQSSCLMEVQRRVDALHETQFLADHLRPVSHEVRDAARAEPCMDGTRIGVLEKISAWVKDPNAKNIFWINGGPGAGKKKILTLLKDGGFDVGHKAVMAQFAGLVQGPFSGLELPGCLVVVMDALDECGSEPDHLNQMLRTLSSWAMLPGQFKLIVTGRNVHNIETILSPISVVFTLTSGVNASLADLADIGEFLRAKLPWAESRACEELEKKAAGLFIWAKTAVTFLNGVFTKVV
ncbi:hypothetical protein BD779DRAFT_1679305 [Infundibulicybe gibba]|nr:hypothetical protein BD779DRAFT_1679305 [Infundibulicybe gibba]